MHVVNPLRGQSAATHHVTEGTPLIHRGMPLRKATLVHRSNGFHTVDMSTWPTVLILAAPQPESARARPELTSPLGALSTLDTTLRRVLTSAMPLLLVAPDEQAHAALSLLPHQEVLAVSPPRPGQSHSDWLVRNIASGVMHRPQSPGWLLLPADMPMLQTSTLHTVANGLRQGPIAYPCHRHRRGHPIAVSSELFSELVRMECEQDLRRLAARYPSMDVDVDDPGIHTATDAQAGLNQLRAQLTGPLLPGSGLRPA